MKRLLAGVLCLVLLAGCVQPAPVSSPSGQDETGAWIFDDTVLVGRVVPLTGPLASFGVGTPYVEQTALDAVNRQGGIVLDGKRCRLELRYLDSCSTVQGAGEAAQALIRDGVDVMIVSNTADTVSPVSAACERAGIACISVDAPASAWVMGGPYQNCWHTFFDNEREMLCFFDVWERIDSNKTIGLLTANDSEGLEVTTFISDLAAVKGYRLVDPGRYVLGTDSYAAMIDVFAREECDIILGVMNTVDFSVFWRECLASGYRPKMCTVAKSCLFSSDVEALGELADGLITEVWWSADFPYASSINGWSCAQLAGDYLERYPQLSIAPPSVGYKHANVEILCDILRRAGSLDLEEINRAAAQTDLQTIVGRVRFNEQHVSIMSIVAGQWVYQEDGSYRQEIVGNYLLPAVEITADIIPIPRPGRTEEEGT